MRLVAGLRHPLNSSKRKAYRAARMSEGTKQAAQEHVLSQRDWLKVRLAAGLRHPLNSSKRKAYQATSRRKGLAAYAPFPILCLDSFEPYLVEKNKKGRGFSSKAEEDALGFDRAWYLATYPDVADAGLDPFQHWLDYGRNEGRHFNGHDSFSPRELAVLAKYYHIKATDPSPHGKVTNSPPHHETAPKLDGAQCWRQRYRTGGNSGAGSYGRLAHFKAETINGFVHEHDIGFVIEFGCGDGAQLSLARYTSYLGFDIADESIEICRSKFRDDPTKEFRNAATWDYECADLALSLDVIFHLIEDDVFHEYMSRLFLSAARFVIIYSSNHQGSYPTPHVKHRQFTDWVQVYHPNFRLIRDIPNRWPLADDDLSQSFSEFFIFEKRRARKHNLPGHLVVSLTSYSKRFPTLELTLRRVLQQTIQPDETILWVTEEDKKQLPEGVCALERCGLTIRATKDLRSYKKIIPALQHYPDSFIITLDDDLAYPLDTVEPLVLEYRSQTEILCRRAHKVTYDAAGRILPYTQWQFTTAAEHDSNLFPTGGAGALYPPRALALDVFDEFAFTTLAPLSDDVWLFWMARLAGSKIRRVGWRYALRPWPGSAEEGLWLNHNAIGGNDKAIAALSARYGSHFLRHSDRLPPDQEMSRRILAEDDPWR